MTEYNCVVTSTEPIVDEAYVPSAVIKKMRFRRLEKIFCNIAVAGLAMIIMGLLALIVVPLMYVLSIVLIILLIILLLVFTMGVILLTPNNWVVKLWDILSNITGSKDHMVNATNVCMDIATVVSVVCMVACALGIVFIILNNGRNKIGKIIGLCAIAVVALVGILLFVQGV